MLITSTVTKKVLEKIVHETFTAFGNLASSSLLDSLKFLGFYYATNAGISINIEDLKTPNVKKEFLQKASEEMVFASEQWSKGYVSDTERFQSIMDSWNIATESLKNRIIEYYQKFDPANNLYIMAFSGARGNMSQVRQLVGMRGLMADQEGKIIDLPIQTNFREGLSSIDYIISSYGARKGIVDTALKTADSGYLTRRLIYLTQDLIIREIDCNTEKGILALLSKNTGTKNLLGRILLNAKEVGSKTILAGSKNNLLTEKVLDKLKKRGAILLKIRSPLTCASHGSVCQNCYGWDLGQRKLISLGDAVGITAAQSIGEPGTQLTMRTFHTGGIFTSEIVQQTLAPFSGKLRMPENLKVVPYRTTHGIKAFKLQQEAILTIVNWKGIEKTIPLEIGSFLYISSSCFVKKDQLISEHPTQSSLVGARRLKPIYASNSGEIRFESLLVRYISREKKPTVKVNQEDGVLWLASGKIFPVPEEAFFLFPEKLSKQKAVASLILTTPYGGIFTKTNGSLFIESTEGVLEFPLSAIDTHLKNCTLKLALFAKNYQYLDPHTALGILYIFPKYEGNVYAIRKKNSKNVEVSSKHLLTYFVITESDAWKIDSEQTNQYLPLTFKKGVKLGELISDGVKASFSGFLLKKDGFKLIFQKATPIFLSRGTILNYKQGDLVLEKKLLATLVNYTQQTEDIVQGLPKIEELIEARVPIIKAELARRPGVALGDAFYFVGLPTCEEGEVFSFSTSIFESELKRNRQIQHILHSIVTNNPNFSNPLDEYLLSENAKAIVQAGSFVDLGEPLTEGSIDPHELLSIFFQYHREFDGPFAGILRSLSKFQLILVNSIQAIYQSQGVNIASKHIEIVIRQMTSSVAIKDAGCGLLLPGERVRLSLILQIHQAIEETREKTECEIPNYEPLFSSATTSSLWKDGFLSAAGFQETKKVLTKAALEGNSDWLRGLKECIMVGRLIPAGSAFLNYKNYLDNIYLFKD